MTRRFIGKSWLIGPIATIALAGSGFAVASLVGSTQTGPTDDTVVAATSASEGAEESPEASDHGTERFHGDATTCALPEGTTLSGDWSHGQFVSAWAASGDHDRTVAAAQSDCGKPSAAVEVTSTNAAQLDDGDEAGEAAGHRSEAAEEAREHRDGDHGNSEEARAEHQDHAEDD